MGIEISSDISDAEFGRSLQVTAPLAAIIVLQGDELPSREQVEKAKSLNENGLILLFNVARCALSNNPVSLEHLTG